ncbi:hypothetical protein HPP92_003304 [Vanilla planifolia]|uniref:Proteasome subunit beta n=1 Tax=Vanilla planifolia TaxID=51239 RepID=A0A835RXE1_VANPL|nr:hypothetical protein HPP92_003304 [Vanilla planifolia]
MALRRDWVYENNGGTCVAIAGLDYCVVAADTRLSVGYSIYTRDHSKICKLADKCVWHLLASGDMKALQKNLAARHLVEAYIIQNIATLMINVHRLNKIYLEEKQQNYTSECLQRPKGKGCVYTYDAVGSYERVGYSCQGTGGALIMPVLDNQLKSPSPLLLPARGDKLEIIVINAAGIRSELMDLRKD